VVVTTIGILWPGAMGSALGQAWREGGATVVTTVAGRSERTRELAGDLTLLGSVDEVVAASDAVVSVVPPARALDQARQIAEAVARTGRAPVVADLNAVSPMTMTEIEQVLAAAGCTVVDGAISGPPPGPATDSVLFLAGPDCSPFDSLVAPGLAAKVVGPRIGGASATKMSTAAVYKGTKALLLQSVLTAAHHGVLDAVVEDLRLGAPELTRTLTTDLAVAVAKGDRFPAEMEEIAATQEAAGQGAELYRAIAEVYRRAYAAAPSRTPEEAARTGSLAEALEGLTDEANEPR
jgi:3-hydroxyisobutyrate dehydrogenase-like beta-hydroxyacid dehydrogenase